MKTLLLMRHAKSSWGNSSLSDHERPLNKRGDRDCRLMGSFLHEQDLIPDKIICSTAVRAKKTVEGLIETLPFANDIDYTGELYHADVDIMLEQLQPLTDDIGIAMLVGHNPGMDEFLDMICDEQVHMPTAAVAEIEFDIPSWHKLRVSTSATLKNLWKPKEIQA
ncbi:MAG: histidine phosphatase family protein [Anaerolineales bacterium]|jgi:phosphohistidine phosphatase